MCSLLSIPRLFETWGTQVVVRRFVVSHPFAKCAKGWGTRDFRPFSLSVLDFGDDAFQVDFFVLYVFDLLRAFGFALDGDGSGVAEFVEFAEDSFEINEALTDEDFFA